MIKRSANAPDTEPEEAQYDLPSESEHLFQVVDVFDQSYQGNKFNLDIDTVIAKCEVVGGEEEGLGLLNRVNLNDQWKGFFATRLFLKAIGEECRGQIMIDTDRWIGRQFYASVIHNKSKDGKKTYANIDSFNFDKLVDNSNVMPMPKKDPNAEPAWDD